MAAVPVTIVGSDTVSNQPVNIVGVAYLTGLEVGGGPIIPPDQPPSTGEPPIPTFPIAGYPDRPYPGNPIYIPGYPGGAPPPNLPPMRPPPENLPAPAPGDPTTSLPPPAGSAGWPVQPITPPPYIVVQYPGVGPVVVAPPATNATVPPPG